jgi:signal transduction histidine kinase
MTDSGERSSPGIAPEHREIATLRVLNEVAGQVLSERSLDVALQHLVDAAKQLTRADFSAIILLRPGAPTEIAHFAYNAPRELFPRRLPRLVGLLAAPIAKRCTVRLDDIRGHPQGAGIPVEHPPIGALLAVPVFVAEEVVGELAVANAPEHGAFDEVDEVVAVQVAAHAAMAVSMARAARARAEADSARKVLLDVSFHNIRTPLTVIKGFVSTLRARGDLLGREERDRCFESIERALDRVQQVAEGRLLEEPVAETAPSGDVVDVDVAGVVQAVAYDGSAAGEAVRVVATVEKGTPPTFRAEPQVVRDLLGNIVANAVKHSLPGETVTLVAGADEAYIRFDVSDRGQGIPAEEQGRIFEQFYRTRASREAGLTGTGLGLWITRRLAELLGGSVGVTSRPGHGSTFWLALPLEGSEPGAHSG